jgi:hypothetical protein
MMTRVALASLASLSVIVVGCSGSVASSSSDECAWGASEKCTLASGDPGSRACAVGKNGYVWGPCEAVSGSGTGSSSGTAPGTTSGTASGTATGTTSSTGTPIVLAFAGEPVEFTRPLGEFDLFGRDASVATDWVGPATPWLAIDLDGNGTIDDGRELFGSMSVLPDGTRASNGFVALAALDDDGDGRITARDAVFDRLLVWRDVNQDRRSSPNELTSAREAGLVSIELPYRVVPRCQAGDCEMERARFVYRDARGVERAGEAVDVHFVER